MLGRLYHERVVHDFQGALYRSAEAHKPCIDGLDPSDITAADNGWTWRRPFSLSDESEVAVGIDTAGEAIARAGYRVTSRGFTGSWQWLNFDAAAVRDEVDEDEPGVYGPLSTVSHASLDVVQASPGDLEVAITKDLYDVAPIAVVSDAPPDAAEPSGLS